MGAITQALGASFEASGGTIRSAAPVARILVRNGRATGVQLAGGEEIHAPLVISNLDVRRTFLEIMDAGDLPRRVPGPGQEFQDSRPHPEVNIRLGRLA